MLALSLGRLSALSLPLLVALGSGGCKTNCEPDERVDVDGNCVPYAGPAQMDEALIEYLPDCQLGQASDRLDLDEGCVDGVCEKDTFAEWVAVHGEPAECDAITSYASRCEWDSGVVSWFSNDGLAYPEDTDEGTAIFLYPPYDGTDARGLGLDVSLRCFLEELGTTDDEDNIDWVVVDGVRKIASIYYRDLSLFVHDQDGDPESATGSNDPDGYVDRLSLFEES